jgi:branched-chain amino acid transport system substrate-binding protein
MTARNKCGGPDDVRGEADDDKWQRGSHDAVSRSEEDFQLHACDSFFLDSPIARIRHTLNRRRRLVKEKHAPVSRIVVVPIFLIRNRASGCRLSMKDNERPTMREVLMNARAVLMLAAVLVIAGCAVKEQEIGVGLIAMLDGQNAGNGRSMLDAARLAVRQANARGGLRIGQGRAKVDLLVEKDPNSPEGALDAARKLLSLDRVVAIIGPQFSGNAIPVARLAESSRIVMVAPMSTNPETTAGKSYVFRIPYLDTFQGFVLARFARETLRSVRAAVLYDVAGDYNRTLAEEFRRAYEARGGTVTSFETYTTDRNTDYSVQLQRIRERSPDVLFLPNYAADVRLQAAQARSSGITAVLLGGDGWDHAFAREALFDGSYVTWHWNPSVENRKARAFVAAYQDAYRMIPEDVAATTYDALGILFAAIEAARSARPEAVRLALHRLNDFEGVTGHISYSAGGDPRKNAFVMQFKERRASVYAVVEP